MLLTALLLGVLANEAEAQRQRAPRERVLSPRQEFRFAHDSWIGPDKIIDHFAVAFCLAAAVDRATFASSGDAERRIFYWGTGAYTLWEVKDGAYAWGPTGARRFGGDGFSVKDLAWSLAGLGLGLIVF